MIITTDDIQVKFYDTDLRQNMTPFSFFNYMQDIAIRNADLNGIGWEYLRPRDLFWVLSRIKLNVIKLPKWQDNICVTTHPRGSDALFAFRDFDFTDRDGTLLAHGDSYWLLLNRSTLRPQRISEQLKDTQGCGDITEDFPKLNKIITSGTPAVTKHITVEYTDLDMNQHVNNAVYAKWAASLFDLDFRMAHNLKSMQINYLTAAKYGNELDVTLYYNEAEHKYYLDCIESDSGAKIYNAVMEWDQVK
jgi:acyl-ACP thioesterase